MIELKEQNINTPEYWDKVFKKEIEENLSRVDLERFAMTEARIKDNSDVIDIGCGRGEFVEYLTKRKKLCRVLGIDFSKIAIDDAKKRILTAKFADIDIYKIADYKSLLERFDYVSCFEVIEHLDRPDLLISNASKILKQSGYLILTTPYENSILGGEEHVYSFDFQDMINFFKKTEWDLITLTRYYKNLNMFVLAKKI